MSTQIGKLAAILTANASGFAAGLKQGDAALASFGSRIPSITSLVGGLGVAFGGISAFAEFSEAERSAAVLESVLRSTSGAAKLTAEELKQFASDRANLTTFDDDPTVAAMAKLATFTRISGDEFKQATVLAQDMSTVLGSDLNASIIQIGKALNDPAKGISALSKSGVSFTDSQKAMIKSLQESGDIVGAQRIILAELSVEFGGAAEAIGNTFSGKVDQAKNAIGGLAGEIVGHVAPAIGTLSEAVKSAAAWASEHSGAVRSTVKAMLTAALAIGTYKAAMMALTAVQKIWAQRQAIILALSGPAGWAQLAAGALIAAGAYAAVSYAMDGTAAETSSTDAEVKKLNASMREGGGDADAYGEAVAGIAPKISEMGKSILDFETSLKNQVMAFSMSADEITLWKLQMKGATDAQLEFSRVTMGQIAELEARKKADEGWAKRQQDMQSAAKQLAKDVMTPAEQYAEKLKEIDRLSAEGLLTEETKARAIAKAADEYGRAAELGKKFTTPDFSKFGGGEVKTAAVEKRVTDGFSGGGNKDVDKKLIQLIEKHKLQLESQRKSEKHLKKLADGTSGSELIL